MRRNRNNSIKRERFIMIASSAFVLAALTMTGISMKQKNQEDMDDGYTIDFSALENEVDDKLNELALQNHGNNEQYEDNENNNIGESTDNNSDNNQDNNLQASGINTIPSDLIEDDLDYMPMNLEEDTLLSAQADLEQSMEEIKTPVQAEEDEKRTEVAALPQSEEDISEEQAASGNDVVVAKSLHFSAENMIRPIHGEIMLPYSMNGSIYFTTLDQYRYNPAVIYSAEEGTSVIACAEARVANIYTDPKIGHAVTLDLGDGYEVTYGQLQNIQVPLNGYVEAGELIAEVAAPTKYYSVEGSNLYFELKKDGISINPEGFF